MTLLACLGCSIQSLDSAILVFHIAGAVAIHWALSPYVLEVAKNWGIPRISLSDFLSLFLLLIWPMAAVLQSKAVCDISPPIWIVLLLLAAVTFLWTRFLWLLETHGVNDFWRRTFFVGVVIPLLFAFGAIVCYCGLFSLMVAAWFPVFGLVLAAVSAGVFLFFWFLANGCLFVVFGRWRGQLPRDDLQSSLPQGVLTEPILDLQRH